jgi:transcriptional regulator with XRE-family HTH domain
MPAQPVPAAHSPATADRVASGPVASGPIATGPIATGPIATGPVPARIILGSKLRQLRQSWGITPQQAAAAIGGSGSKISRIELGRHVAKETDVVDLLDRYQVSDRAEREELLRLASVATGRPLRRYADLVPGWFLTYLGLEEAARSVHCYDRHFIPGLLQTAEYTAGLSLLLYPRPASADRGGSAVSLSDLQAERISHFGTGGRTLLCVLDEAALYPALRFPAFLGAHEWRDQLAQLRAAAAKPGISVRIRPLKAQPPGTEPLRPQPPQAEPPRVEPWAYPAGLRILRFGDPLLPDVVYAEQAAGVGRYDRHADVTHYRQKLEQLLGSSAPAEQTDAIVERAMIRSHERWRTGVSR